MRAGTRAPRWIAYADRYPDAGHAVAGNIKVLVNVRSPRLGNRRDLLVYLPSSYEQEHRRFPVIYMHDGQNLFDESTSHAGEWRVDDLLEGAGPDGPEVIVVGIPNMGEQRVDEYSPFTDPEHGGGRGDDYLAFIVETVKPIIDRSFRTIPDRAHTGIAGSSMGGLISLYALFQQREIFGFAGVMSPALWFADRTIFSFIEAAPFLPAKIYLDVGTGEGKQTLSDVRRLRDLLIRKGYRRGRDLMCVIEKGAGHTEEAWGRRFGRGLGFLLAGGAVRPATGPPGIP